MGVFVRRVKTASGATAVQIVHKRGRRVLSDTSAQPTPTTNSPCCCRLPRNAAMPGS